MFFKFYVGLRKGYSRTSNKKQQMPTSSASLQFSINIGIFESSVWLCLPILGLVRHASCTVTIGCQDFGDPHKTNMMVLGLKNGA